MADQNNSGSNGDLVSLDDATQAPPESGSGASTSPDSLLNAADLFQSQLEQISTWKNQLAQQMEILRRDGVKVAERQKALMQEKQKLVEERQAITAEQARLAQEAESFKSRAAELEKITTQNQSAVEATLRDLQLREAQLAAAQKSLAEHQAQNLTQDVRLKEGLEQLEIQRRQLAEAQRQAAQDRETAANQLRQIDEDRQALARQKQDIQKRTDALDGEHAERLEALAKQTKRLTERRAEIEAQSGDAEKSLQSRIAQATETLKAELTQLQKQLQQQPALAANWQKRETQLQQSLSAAEAELVQLREKVAGLSAELEKAKASPPGSGDSGKVRKLAEKLADMEAQRDDLTKKLDAAQEAAKQAAASVPPPAPPVDTSALESQIAELREQSAELEKQVSHWKSQAKLVRTPMSGAKAERYAEQFAAQREKLIRQARSIRAFRHQARSSRSSLEKGRADLAHQREQYRARKQNLEQVKRLLEKQEMVMARKLADHNAIRTVAAAGIFLIMILGSVFFGVYRFVSPVYRSEAIIQLSPPANLQLGDLDAWLKSQQDFIQSPEVTGAAWKILRTSEVHYVMHDVREEWTASLNPKHLMLNLDPAARTLSIRYTGPYADGVEEVCNALATAYVSPNLRDTTEATRTTGGGGAIIQKAVASATPFEDNRLTLTLEIVAGVMVVSLIMVMVFRHFVARQLREIDDMADEKELAEIHNEIPPDAKPA